MSEVKAPVDLKRKIRRAARALIEEHGYQHVQMQDIAQKAGIGRATLYRHYPAKDNIAAEITQNWGSSFTRRLAPALADITEGKDRVTAILHGIIDEAAANMKLLGASLSVLVTAPHLITIGLDVVIEGFGTDIRSLSQKQDSFVVDVLTRQLLAELLMLHNETQDLQEAKQRLSRLTERLFEVFPEPVMGGAGL